MECVKPAVLATDPSVILSAPMARYSFSESQPPCSVGYARMLIYRTHASAFGAFGHVCALFKHKDFMQGSSLKGYNCGAAQPQTDVEARNKQACE